MRRALVLVSAAALSLVGAVLAGGIGGRTVAQDATSPPGAVEIAPGVTAEVLAVAEGQAVPPLFRLRFAPGAAYPASETDPSISLVYAEAGTLTFTIEAQVTITRAGATGARDVRAAGTAFTLEPGDYFVFPPLVAGEARNDGQDPAAILVAALVPAGLVTPTP